MLFCVVVLGKNVQGFFLVIHLFLRCAFSSLFLILQDENALKLALHYFALGFPNFKADFKLLLHPTLQAFGGPWSQGVGEQDGSR